LSNANFGIAAIVGAAIESSLFCNHDIKLFIFSRRAARFSADISTAATIRIAPKIPACQPNTYQRQQKEGKEEGDADMHKKY
tara:strand:- start:1037 stop:1282 length:246 start_codon:yes stop_codon:yes gene_type:complete